MFHVKHELTGTQPVIEVQQLSHRYGTRQALRDLSFSVEPGEVFGLLGPNGAGKTTTIRLANGLFPPTSGGMRVLGFDPTTDGEKIRLNTGVLTETPALYERLTAHQNLRFFGAMAGLSPQEIQSRATQLLEFFDLSERAQERVGVFSKGMKQRLALARALLHQPPLLFLDEPTSGLDPESSQQVHDLILSLRDREKRTVFLCTHNLYEAEILCDRLAILNSGRLLEVGSLAELRQRTHPGTWVVLGLLQPLPEVLQAALRQTRGVLAAQPDGELSWQIQVQEEAVIPVLIQRLAAEGAQILSLQPRQISLQDIYFELQARVE